MSTTKTIERVETEMRAAARRRGMTMKELAARMGVSKCYLSQIATGKKHWTPKMRDKVTAVLGEVPGQGTVHVQQEAVDGESTYIRERARELGLTMRDLADRVGVSHGYMTQVARGQKNMGVKVQARVESALEAPATVAAAQCATVNLQAMWDRMNAHEISQNEVARRAGISSAHLSNIISGKANPSPGRAEEAACGPLPAVKGGGAGHVRRGESAGLAEGRAERNGGARRWRQHR